MELFLLAALTCAVIIIVGPWINKHLRLPWMFTVVLLGMALAALGLFRETVASSDFRLLSRLGMLLFLFSIGSELHLDEIRKLGRYIVGGELVLTLVEGTLIGLLLYLVFPAFVSHSFLVALLCGIAFGTVGEVILLAILKEFGLEGTQFGQLALGIGVADDIWELLVLAVIVALPGFMTPGGQAGALARSVGIVLSLVGVLLATVLLSLLGKTTRRHLERVPGDSFVLPFGVFLVIFSFLYVGTRGVETMGVVAAIFSGVAVNQVFPPKLIQPYKKMIYFIGNMFLGPFFFLSLGGSMSVSSLRSYPLLIAAIMGISLISRVALSYLLYRKLLGDRQSLVLGVGLTAKFSTSVISENMLYTTGLIAQPVYSAIMMAFILLKPIIIAAFSSSLASIRDEIPGAQLQGHGHTRASS